MSQFQRAIEDAFDRYDTDRSGAIDVGELGRLCASLGAPMSHRDLSTAMSYLDSDRSGRVEKSEFVRWWMNRRAGILDLNGDGKVDAVEESLAHVSLAGTDEALRRTMEGMRFERDGLHREVVKLEEEKVLTQREIQRKQEELQRLNADLMTNHASREELDGIIRETEGAYRKILEGSAALLDMLKRRTPHMPDDLTGAGGSPYGSP